MHIFARDWLDRVSTDSKLSVQQRAGLCLFAQFIGDGGRIVAQPGDIEASGYGPASTIARNVALARQTPYMRGDWAVLP